MEGGKKDPFFELRPESRIRNDFISQEVSHQVNFLILS